MFSGIVEEFATVVAIQKDRDNIDFTLRCSFVDELSIDQSVAHNGVCLTVVTIENGTYTVTAMPTSRASSLSVAIWLRLHLELQVGVIAVASSLIRKIWRWRAMATSPLTKAVSPLMAYH